MVDWSRTAGTVPVTISDAAVLSVAGAAQINQYFDAYPTTLSWLAVRLGVIG
jgi:hypothetical protein